MGWGPGAPASCRLWAQASLAGICARRRTHFLLLRQKKVSKEKATPSLRPLRCATGQTWVVALAGCAAELTARWRASFKQLRQVSSQSMRAATRMPTPQAPRPRRSPRGLNSPTRPSLRSARKGHAPRGAERSDGPCRPPGVIGVGFQLNPIDTCAAPSRSGRHAAAPAPQKLRRLPDHQPCRGKVLHVARDDAVQARVPGGFVQHGVFVVGKAGVQRVGQR